MPLDPTEPSARVTFLSPCLRGYRNLNSASGCNRFLPKLSVPRYRYQCTDKRHFNHHLGL